MGQKCLVVSCDIVVNINCGLGKETERKERKWQGALLGKN